MNQENRAEAATKAIVASSAPGKMGGRNSPPEADRR